MRKKSQRRLGNSHNVAVFRLETKHRRTVSIRFHKSGVKIEGEAMTKAYDNFRIQT